MRTLERTERAVAINFCGGCNPVINRGDIAVEIRSALVADGFAVGFNDWNAGFIVRLSGCPTNCTSREHPPGPPEAVIAGRTFGAVTAAEGQLADLAIAAVRTHFGAGDAPEPAVRPIRNATEHGGDIPGHSQCEKPR